ncbi:Presenilins-associated rhomboid-like protein, mitochondrial [Pseudolycoriella hygida]|uniref:rhomboid protease n=1 Tax=Pseudolycoriella hygida TaxID=35572 RepID=A0A9Q0MT87_9DIPT|nr:Presenilins-associated rhomboid-like protein, mitochondrial [Pseudolycoriella hygida]
MNLGHSKCLINYFSPQISNLRSSFLQQPRKILRSSFSRYSNGTNRTPFKVKSTQVIIENASNGQLPNSISNLWKPIGFTVTFVTGTFAVASIWQYENIYSPPKFNHDWFKSKFVQPKNDIKTTLQFYWNKLSSSEKVFVPICALNLLVFGLWRLQRTQPFMLQYFCSNPVAKATCWPMLLSTFSHYSAFHIFANMYVLHSFANVAVGSLGKEQFLYLYLCGGVLSTLSSYVFKTALATPGLSLGAVALIDDNTFSGAIMAILAFVCVQYPDTELGIIFLPIITFSAGSAIKVLVGIDLAGCILGWKFFDHAAHLGGALTGIFWYFVGVNHIWPKRIRIQQYWHQIRSDSR